jgi:NADH:ubiquinone oxidoreductase subunit E
LRASISENDRSSFVRERFKLSFSSSTWKLFTIGDPLNNLNCQTTKYNRSKKERHRSLQTIAMAENGSDYTKKKRCSNVKTMLHVAAAFIEEIPTFY